MTGPRGGARGVGGHLDLSSRSHMILSATTPHCNEWGVVPPASLLEKAIVDEVSAQVLNAGARPAVTNHRISPHNVTHGTLRLARWGSVNGFVTLGGDIRWFPLAVESLTG